jgi:small subunit ribosomal protein S16
MLTIRLSRIGKKKKPMYRLVVSEKARDPYGRALEILGSYNPFTKELITKKDRIEHYLANGAEMSNTVNNLLLENKIIKGEKVKASKPGKKKEEEKKDDNKKEEAKIEDKEDKPVEKEEKKEESK